MSDTVEERLRAFVRARIHPQGEFYRRGDGGALAKALDVDQSWVSRYVDPEPAQGEKRYANLDQALAICRFFGVSLDSFQRETPPAPRQSREQRSSA